MQQKHLNSSQLSKFHIDDFANLQLTYFRQLISITDIDSEKVIVDIGGGSGFFAKKIAEFYQRLVRVIDLDKVALEKVSTHSNVESVYGDALDPSISGDEGIVCFNLVLHHLVGKTNHDTSELQKKALSIWTEQSEYIFVTEYIYDSYINDFSGRLIYEITSSRLLSFFARLISRFVPSLRANTFGVGVRFRSHQNWIDLFESCGYEIVSVALGDENKISVPLKLLLIKRLGVNGFLLKASRNL